MKLSFRGSIGAASVVLPWSKSLANRHAVLWACSGHALPEMLHEPSMPQDVRLLAKALEAPYGGTLNLGMGGTTLRFFMARALLFHAPTSIDVHPRLQNRPIQPLVEALTQLGMTIDAGWPKRLIPPKVTHNQVKLDSSVSSQFLSALLLIGAFMPHGLLIELQGPVASSSYLELTLQCLDAWGIRYQRSPKAFEVFPGYRKPACFPLEADWSSAIYPLMLSGLQQRSLRMEGLRKNSGQPDEALLALLPALGMEWDGAAHWKAVPGSPKPLHLDCEACPDLVPGLVVWLLMRDTPFHLSGLDTLPGKESNRIEALARAAEKAHRPLKSSSRHLAWNGEGADQGGEELQLSAENDHRLAMAYPGFAHRFKVVSLEGWEEVKKSFPGFWAQCSGLLRMEK